jgi:CheY-like chemotaxis protein
MTCYRATVLVIEDDNEVALLLYAVLSEFGYKVVQAQDGVAALVQIALDQPEVILCDLNLPKMPGSELLGIVRRQFPNILLIAMSGSPSESVPPGIIADAFYEKGKAPGSLLDILGNLISSESGRRKGTHGTQLAS